MIRNDINVPYYCQLKKLLTDKIYNGTLSGGEKIPSENELVKEYGVSRITARRALQELAGEGIVFRVQGKGSFVNPGIFKDEAKHIIGLFCPLAENILLNDPYYRRVFNGIIAEGKKQASEVKRIEAENSIYSQDIDGIIFLGLNDNFPLRKYFGTRLPFILAGYLSEEPSISYCVTDNFKCSYLAVKHLVELGHSQIAFMSHFSETVNMRERIIGYKNALNAFGLPYRKELVQEGDAWTNGGYIVMKKFLDLPVPPSAAVISTDGMALSALKALEERDLKVGKDMSIISMGNMAEKIAPNTVLTSIELYPEKIGQAALTGIINIMDNPADPPVRARIDVELKNPMASCGYINQINGESL
ncbi:MAG: GntR family transcriptional regulator [Victivallaceae bacterium]|nr:GntR family transcriptional regulator [Victivallaceae bacterium]